MDWTRFAISNPLVAEYMFFLPSCKLPPHQQWFHCTLPPERCQYHDDVRDVQLARRLLGTKATVVQPGSWWCQEIHWKGWFGHV